MIARSLCRIALMTLVALCVTLTSTSPRSTTPSEKATVTARMANLPLRFEANAGQWHDEHVRFVARQGSATLSITDVGMTIGQRDEASTAAVSMKLVGAKAHAPKGENELITKSNFFLGDDKTKWRTNVPNYGQVRAKDSVPGVDVVWHGGENGLEYDVEVSAGVDARRLTFEIEGADRIDVAEDGTLEIATSAGTLVQRPPRVVQDGRDLPTRYVMRGAQRVGFAVEGYDDTLALLIDPVLTYSMQLGNSKARGIAVDTMGNAYVTGTTIGSLPTANAYQATYDGGGSDAFVTKLNAAGNALVYSTYLGGAGLDLGNGITVDTAGNAYVTGATSGSFPTANAYQATYGGGTNGFDVFVTKLSAAGNALVYSTYLGGTASEQGLGIAVDMTGNAYVTGGTDGNFPTVNAYQSTFGGDEDAFVTKLNVAGNALVYSTYLGGVSAEGGQGIAVDTAGNAYVTGSTLGGFPTVNAYQGTFGGLFDAFVIKLNAAGNALLYSTYLGGAGEDHGAAIAVDTAGDAYVTGVTGGSFPTANAYQSTFGGVQDVFVTKLNVAGNALVYSTYLGGADDELGMGIAVDTAGDAYVTGTTDGSGFPIANAYQSTNGGGSDVFVTKLNAAGSALAYSTYLGGIGADFGWGIAVDAAGSAYVTGSNQTVNCQGYGNTATGFVAKIGDDPELLQASPQESPCAATGLCAPGLSYADGVCCDTACDGACEACDVAGRVGTCTPVMGAPHGSRPACQKSSSCAASCDGTNTKACTYGPDVCATTCSNANEDDMLCNTAGGCKIKKSHACDNNLVCADATKCKDKCTTDADCLPGFACTPDGTCQPAGTSGGGCSCNAGPASSTPWFILLGTFGVSLARARRRRA